jgi:phosphoglycerate dehydrogenase-like enzyme
VDDARTVGAVVVAFPWTDTEAWAARLREQHPGVEITAAPYTERYVDRVPGATAELTDADRALWARAEVALAFEVPADLARVAPNLRWIQAINVGIDHLTDRGVAPEVTMTNVSGISAASIAEFVLARLLQVWKRLPEIDAQQRERRWAHTAGRSAEGRTVAVIGLGAIGTEVARRCRAFGMSITGTRRSHRPGETHPDVDELLGPDDLLEALAVADVVVASLPGIAETENLFDAAAFAAMKPGAIFCNVGRGSLVDETAMIVALERGHLGAAIIDVAKNEPLPPDDPLWAAPNIYISPHCSASQDQYLDRVFDFFADNLGRYRRGEDLRNVVDPETGY